MNQYPAEYFARGITRKECLVENKIRSCVFDFDKNPNPDGYKEMSIVWLINKMSVQYAKDQKNSRGETQFKLGFAIVNHLILDSLIKDSNGRLKHYMDHQPHGLLLADYDKTGLRRISQHLAECSRYVSFSDNIPCGNT